MNSEPQHRKYWAQRHGAQADRLSLADACRLFLSLASGLREEGYFQEWFGYTCVDAGDVLGRAGFDPTAYAYRKTRLHTIWPPSDEWLAWDLQHLLTAVEFLFDVISHPLSGRHHSYGHCGWHYDTFDQAGGRRKFQAEANAVLVDLETGYRLQGDGEVVHTDSDDLQELFGRPVPADAPVGVKTTVRDAIRKFRRGTAGESERHDAVRDLADVLEVLRPRLKKVLSAPDEDALFNIANNFADRHMNDRQNVNYDRDVWLPWMFSFFLASIHAGLELLGKREGTRSGALVEPAWLQVPEPLEEADPPWP